MRILIQLPSTLVLPHPTRCVHSFASASAFGSNAVVFDYCQHRHILADQLRLGPAATGDLTLLLNAIQLTSKFIATNVRKARLINLYVSPPLIHSHPKRRPDGHVIVILVGLLVSSFRPRLYNQEIVPTNQVLTNPSISPTE